MRIALRIKRTGNFYLLARIVHQCELLRVAIFGGDPRYHVASVTPHFRHRFVQASGLQEVRIHGLVEYARLVTTARVQIVELCL